MKVFATDNFRKNLRTLLNAKGISQRAIGEKSGISYPYVNRILQGTVTPALDICDALADAASVPLNEMVLPPREFERKIARKNYGRDGRLRTA